MSKFANTGPTSSLACRFSLREGPCLSFHVHVAHSQLLPSQVAFRYVVRVFILRLFALVTLPTGPVFALFSHPNSFQAESLAVPPSRPEFSFLDAGGWSLAAKV